MDNSILDHLPVPLKKFYEICLEGGIDLDTLDFEKIKKANNEMRDDKETR